MEMALSMGTFQALDQNEMFEIDGGASSTGKAIGLTVATVALGMAFPVGYALGSVAAGAALALTGGGLIGKISGHY